MNIALLDKIAKREKINLSQYDYIKGFVYGGFTYVLFGVRDSAIVADAREGFRFRTSSLLKKWENGEECPEEYLTEGWKSICEITK